MVWSAPPQERRAWIDLVVASVGYPVYLLLLALLSPGVPLSEKAVTTPMVSVAVGSVVVGGVLGSAFGVRTDPEARRPDERDRMISNRAERIGLLMVVAGACGGLVLAILEADRFWIANAIYLGFFLYSIVSNALRIHGYRRGFDPRW